MQRCRPSQPSQDHLQRVLQEFLLRRALESRIRALRQADRRRRKEEGNHDLFHTSSHAFLHALRLGCVCTRALHSRVDSVPCVITWLGAFQYTGQASAVIETDGCTLANVAYRFIEKRKNITWQTSSKPRGPNAHTTGSSMG